jgi:hypothetical protein
VNGDAGMLLALCLFSVPVAVLISIVIYLWRVSRSTLRRIPALLAIISGFVSPMIGLWGLAHINTLRLRSAIDYGFERGASKVSDFALLLSLIWLITSRRWYAGATFAAALLVSIYWIMILSTL